MRDDFSELTKRVLAARVSHRCSRPGCGAATAGPHSESGKALNVGVAAHITAAALGGPRYDSSISEEERSGPENGLWLCQTCAKLVDNDPARYTVEVLRGWKSSAEDAALQAIGKTAPPGTEKFAAPLPEKLRAPRASFSPETAAYQSVLRQCRFYLRVVRLIQDVSQLPNHSITNIARPPEYHDLKRVLFEKFNEEYTLFKVDLENSLDILRELQHEEVAASVREAATTTAALVEWAEDPRNEPINLIKLHPTSRISNAAREASMKLCRLAARRLIELENV